ncbi:MAG: glycosyltransferase family 4 protein [Acidobacteria bacterium]|nr:glycosyltransferase family 4 protein [Acidobacteriota bacterium]MBI3658233.1 glycosyltransferase family 4 protein [Acidobacteriota bacterium]
MRIGVDACCWSNRRGYGRFTRELLSALLEYDTGNQYVALVDAQTAATGDFPKSLNPVIVHTSRQPSQAASTLSHRSARDLLAFTRAAQKQNFDVFFFPSVYSYFPLLRRARVILGIHDVMAEQHPELIFPNKKDRFFWRIKMRAALKSANLIVTVSEHARRGILEQFHWPPARVRVVREAPAKVFAPVQDLARTRSVKLRYGLPAEGRFILYVGGMGPHKNLDTLIRGYATLLQSRRVGNVVMAMVGDKADVFYSQYPALQETAQKLNLSQSVVFTGFVPDEDLACLYSATELFVLPSHDEGFGLPAVEAMACGAPVAVSASGALPEVVGDAGLLFDPSHNGELHDALSFVLLDQGLQSKMRAKSLQRAAQFSWRQAAQEMKTIFAEVAEKA